MDVVNAEQAKIAEEAGKRNHFHKQFSVEQNFSRFLGVNFRGVRRDGARAGTGGHPQGRGSGQNVGSKTHQRDHGYCHHTGIRQGNTMKNLRRPTLEQKED